MGRFTRCAFAVLFLVIPAAVTAQTSAPPILGSWKVDPKVAAKQTSGPTVVIVRPDSSASYGKETVRWRLTGKNKISLVLGGEWVQYDMKVKKDQLTLSGGDLTQPIILRRVGPPTARPDSAKIPPDPDTEPGA